MGALLYFIQDFKVNILMSLIIKIILGSGSYILVLLILKEENLYEIIEKILLKFRRK